ncbi:MAG: porin family protein [Prevotella sp.]|nr:porin family protein [Prevotella sp.]
MKKVLLLMALCLSFSMANAQISTGQNSSKVIRTGNRAQAGDFGLYIGATTDMFKKITDGNTKVEALPLINFKYMGTDKLEFRVGLEWWRSSETAESKGGDSNTTEKSYMLYPGVAYHVNNQNLLDVYFGAELPVGFGGKSEKYGDEKESASEFKIGLGAFVGLQAYIANLPLALGVEYGVSALNHSASDGIITRDGLTIRDDIDSKKFKLGQQVRLTLSYYFNL